MIVQMHRNPAAISLTVVLGDNDTQTTLVVLSSKAAHDSRSFESQLKSEPFPIEFCGPTWDI
jgi:hypothetical protein